MNKLNNILFLSLLLLFLFTPQENTFAQDYGGAPQGTVVSPKIESQNLGFNSFKTSAYFQFDESVYNTTVFTFGEIVLFSYSDNTELTIVNNQGEPVLDITLDKDDYHVFVGNAGIYRIFGSNSFTALIGDATTHIVHGWYAVDQSGRGVSTLFNTYMMDGWDSRERFIIAAYENNTEVTVRNLDTSELLHAGVLNAGEFHTMANTPYDTFLQVSASKPVSALSYGDTDYYVPSSNGTFIGTMFLGHSSYIGNWTNSITVTGYHDDTNVKIINSETGDTIAEYTLNEGQVHSTGITEPTYWQLESDKPVIAGNIPYAGWTGNYAYKTRAIDSSGTGAGTLFYIPTIESQIDIFSFEDDNFVTVKRLGRDIDYPYPDSITIFEGVLNAGEGYNFTSTTGRYVYKIESEKDVSVIQSNGGAGAEFMPLSFTQTLPDLAISSDGINFIPDQETYDQGEEIEVSIDIYNYGPLDAVSVEVHVYEGDPDGDGVTPLLHNETVPLIEGNSSEKVSFIYEVPSDPEFREIVVIVDPDNLIQESNKANNKASRFIIPNDDLLPPIAVVVDSPAALGLSNDLELIPNPFLVTATLINTGEGAANDVTVELKTFDGLSVSQESENITNIGTMEVGQTVDVSWLIIADSEVTGTNRFSIFVESSNAENKVINRAVNIPGPFMVELTTPPTSPQTETIQVPQYGSGYIYYKINGEDAPYYYDGTFTVGLLDHANADSYAANAIFLEDNLFQVDVSSDFMSAEQFTNFQLADSFQAGNDTYFLDGQQVLLSAESFTLPWNRTWSVFAGGSAGVSGTIGSIGLGASIAAAKASVSGSGGVGLDIQVNERNERFWTRRASLGVAVGLEAPSINMVIESDKINLDEGASAVLEATGTAGQTVSFSHLNISEDEKKMAEAGFLLETLSFGGVALSPGVGVFIPAIVNTINNISGVDQFFAPALLNIFAGAGLEGNVSAGIGAEFGPFKVKAAEATSGFVLNSNFYTYPESQTMTKNPENFHRLLNYTNFNNQVRSSIGVSTAVEYGLSSLSWDLSFGDVAVNGGSLFSKGAGSEMSMRANFNESNDLHSIELSLIDGYDLDIITTNRSVFQTTHILIPGTYSTLIADNNLGISSLFSPGSIIPFGVSMADDFQNTYNLIAQSIEPEHPIEIVEFETHGKGNSYNFGLSFDGALGVGGGLSIGFEYSMYDEVAFPKNYVEVYEGAANYTLYSSEFHQEMVENDLTDLFHDLFSGFTSLVENALLELLSIYSDFIEAGEQYFAELNNRFDDFVVSITGIFETGGEIIAYIFSPNSNRVVQKAFEVPEIRSMYASPNVYYMLPTKSVDGDDPFLAEAGSELIVISDVVDLVFVPEGSSDSLLVLDQTIDIEMIIKDSDLSDNDFDESDKESVNLYRYMSDKIGWVRVESELSGDIVSAEISTLGSYALGIEINRSDDNIPPEIFESGYLDATENNSIDEIFARVRDDRYGSGIDFGSTFMIINQDTVDYTYQPARERIFFELGDYQNLTGGTEEVVIIATDFAGNRSTENFTFVLLSTSSQSDDTIPDQFVLHHNYPNPFNPQTVIPFELAETAHVEINIYDVAGRFITRLADERFSAGRHQVTWDTSIGTGRELSSGVYFYQVKSGSFNQVKKMMLIK